MVKGSLAWVSLDPARGAKVPKTRPCIIVSRTEANDVLIEGEEEFEMSGQRPPTEGGSPPSETIT
jgi:PemK-like, MazF-like toxin of type II toxin-antitoxin system